MNILPLLALKKKRLQVVGFMLQNNKTISTLNQRSALEIHSGKYIIVLFDYPYLSIAMTYKTSLPSLIEDNNVMLNSWSRCPYENRVFQLSRQSK